MKNILGTKEDLKLYDANGTIKYLYFKTSKGYSYECTYDDQENELTYKDSNGFSYESTYDEQGNELTYKDSDSFSYERTCDENGNELTYKDSGGLTRGLKPILNKSLFTKIKELFFEVSNK